MNIQKISKWKEKRTKKCKTCNKKCKPKYIEMPNLLEYMSMEIKNNKSLYPNFNIKIWEKLTKYYCSDECLMTEKI